MRDFYKKVKENISKICTVAFLGLIIALFTFYKTGIPELSICCDDKMSRVFINNKSTFTVTIVGFHMIYAHFHPDEHPHPLVDFGKDEIKTWVPPGSILEHRFDQTFLDEAVKVWGVNEIKVLFRVKAINRNIPFTNHDYFVAAKYHTDLNKWTSLGTFEEEWKNFFAMKKVRYLSNDEIKEIEKRITSDSE